MLKWIADNWLTIVLIIAVLAAVGLAAASIVRKKRAGGSVSCGCGCANCPMSGACHKKQP